MTDPEGQNVFPLSTISLDNLMERHHLLMSDWQKEEVEASYDDWLAEKLAEL